MFSTSCGQVGSEQYEPLQHVAAATCCTENKDSLSAQPLPQPEESLCKQQGFDDLLTMYKASCLRFAALLQNLDTTLCSCLVLPQILGLSGYRFLSYLCVAQLESLGLAFTLLSQ